MKISEKFAPMTSPLSQRSITLTMSIIISFYKSLLRQSLISPTALMLYIIVSALHMIFRSSDGETSYLYVLLVQDPYTSSSRADNHSV